MVKPIFVNGKDICKLCKYVKRDKETEKKIKEIVKNINSRIEYYEKVRKTHKKDKDISGLYFCVGLLCQCDRDLELLKNKFPEYFKESDKMSEVPKLEIKTLKQLIDEYENAELEDGLNSDYWLYEFKYYEEDDIKARIRWLKSQITLNDVNNRNVINAIDEAFSELFKEE